MRNVNTLLTITLFSAGIHAAEIHPEVDKALRWELPENTCEEPTLRGAEPDIVESDGRTVRYDVDSYKLARFERKKKRWTKCVEKYKRGLIKEFGRLRDSAKHGLTESQAETILGKMKTIQTVVDSPTGTLPE